MNHESKMKPNYIETTNIQAPPFNRLSETPSPDMLSSDDENFLPDMDLVNNTPVREGNSLLLETLNDIIINSKTPIKTPPSESRSYAKENINDDIEDKKDKNVPLQAFPILEQEKDNKDNLPAALPKENHNWERTSQLLSLYGILVLNHEFTEKGLPFLMGQLSIQNALYFTSAWNLFEGASAMTRLLNKGFLNPENHKITNYKSGLHYSAYILGAFFDAFVIGRSIAGLGLCLQLATSYQAKELHDLGDLLLNFNQEAQFGRTMGWVTHFYSKSGRINNELPARE
jgi:hypothetical protein